MSLVEINHVLFDDCPEASDIRVIPHNLADAPKAAALQAVLRHRLTARVCTQCGSDGVWKPHSISCPYWVPL